MTWQGWTALGVLGAAVAVPVIRKRLANKHNGSLGSGMSSSRNFSPSESSGTMGGRNAPASDTWAQGSGMP